MTLLTALGLMTRKEHERIVSDNPKIEVEAMRQACIELVRGQQQYEGSDYPVCNHIVHMIEQVIVPNYDATSIGDLPSRLMGWAGKARAHGRDVIELDVSTVDRIVAHLAGETDWEAKFKQAITDLAEANDRSASLLQEEYAESTRLSKELADLRPDALAMRRKRQMDRDRRKGKA